MKNPFNVEIEPLINNHLEWARTLGKNYANNKLPKTIDPEWVASVAVAGLYDAATKWNPNLIAFKNYASRRIKGHIRDELRKVPLFFNKTKKDHPTAVQISQITNNETENEEYSFLDIEDTNVTSVLHKIEMEELKKLIERKARKELNGTNLDWVLHCVLGTLTQKELSMHTGLSEGRIAQVKKDPIIIKFFESIKEQYFTD